MKKQREKSKDPKQAKKEEPASTEMRLNKFIAHAGICSRRKADDYIADGHVEVNDKVVFEMGYKVQRDDKVTFKGKEVKPTRSYVYILLNKPKNCISTTEDPQERNTVMNIIKNASNERVYPVGRLDRNTTGLLLLTNDGELTNKLSHPRYEIQKIYSVELDKPLAPHHIDQIRKGLDLEDGNIKVDDVQYTDASNKRLVGVEIHSGKNRIVRRIFESLDYKVKKLDRVMYASLTKKNLPRGKWRMLSKEEVIRLKFMS